MLILYCNSRDGTEIWYHQLGRVEPPRPRATAAGAEDYYAKGDARDLGRLFERLLVITGGLGRQLREQGVHEACPYGRAGLLIPVRRAAGCGALLMQLRDPHRQLLEITTY